MIKYLLENEKFNIPFVIGNKKEEGNSEPVSTNIAFYNQVKLRGDYTRSKVLARRMFKSYYSREQLKRSWLLI